MKRDATGENHARKLSQRAIHLDCHTTLSRSQCGKPALIVSIVLNDLQPLDDEGCQQFDFFFFSDWSMNAGRKNYRHARRRDTGLHETSYQEVYNLRTCSCTRCVGNDDQYRIIAASDFVYRRGGNWIVKNSTALAIPQRRTLIIPGGGNA